jgi:ATP-dependent RNA helicase RhlE
MEQRKQTTGCFDDLMIEEKILSILTLKGFKIPTPIQHQIIPGAIEGKDVIGIAQTGTGKTLAFGIPMIQRLITSNTQGLILVPTRELALQVEEALSNIGNKLRLRTAVIIGGTSKQPQLRALKRSPHIVIATPGRLVDFMNQGQYTLKNISIITLDEADRMLDVGFLPQIKRILQTAPKEKQVMLFSATMPKTIATLASTFMKLPLRIEVAPQGTSSKNIEQEVFIIKKNDKMRLLDSILTQYKEDTILIFSRTKHGAKKITRDIRHMRHTATEIHGNRSQAQRKIALEGFIKGKFRIMVATDIAARGIDVQKISLVINYDLPDNSEDYVHRIGRTGRAGRSGKAISFAAPAQRADIKKIERLIRKSLKVLSLPELPAARKKPPRPNTAENRKNNPPFSKVKSKNRDKNKNNASHRRKQFRRSKRR